MKVLKWSPEFYPNFESPVVPVWVGLPGLHFFEKSALFCIASVLGNPLKIDEPTAKLSRPTVARVCVEIDVSKTRHRRIWLGDEKDGFWQDVIFENPPRYCDFCKALVHDNTICYKKFPELLKESKKISAMENSLVEKNRNSGHPVKTSVKEKPKDTWRKKEIEAAIDRKTDAEGWTMVGEKKKNKIQSGPSTEMTAAEGKTKRLISSEISVKVPEEVRAPSSEKLGHPWLIEDLAGKMKSAISLTPLNLNRQVRIANNMVSVTDEMAGGRQKASGRNPSLPSDQINMEGLDLISSSTSSQPPFQNPIKIQPSDGNPFKGDNFLTLLTNENESGGHGSSLVEASEATEKEKAWLPDLCEENKIRPLDGSIDLQPSDIPNKKTGSSIGPSEMGCQLRKMENPSGPSNPNNFQGVGNLGFEFFKGPNPIELQSAGLKHLLDRRMGQSTNFVDGHGNYQALLQQQARFI